MRVVRGGDVSYRCRMYSSPPQNDEERATFIVHAAAIVSNMEFAETACHISRGAGGIHEAPRNAVVTCIKCLAEMLKKGDRWT